jgi:hypothetical protein
MEGERVVFTQEIEPAHNVRVVARGAVDEAVVDALEGFVNFQKKRLGLIAPKKPENGQA